MVGRELAREQQPRENDEALAQRMGGMGHLYDGETEDEGQGKGKDEDEAEDEDMDGVGEEGAVVLARSKGGIKEDELIYVEMSISSQLEYIYIYLGYFYYYYFYQESIFLLHSRGG